ncbi:SEC-C domain-containing protein [Desulfobacterota bacterium AH_259_B03_O07]|nr:SEC-C domain-containing protein [Desulfobacterota bacterium AH_259_B03_O07]
MTSIANLPIVRAEGVTDSERYLKRLCDRTFLSLWSYPGIYRDQGLQQMKEGKEVCDLLVVFEDHVIVFSDKDCKFPDSGNIGVDWNRWFKRAIVKSAKQSWGAERWIRSYPDRLFLDRACKNRFPLELPDAKTAKFHLIVVAHDTSSRCRKELGGSGSLMINSFVKGDSHYVTEDAGVGPFIVGDIDADKTFVHVFDDTTLDIVMNTVDTIADFIAYLTCKERFLRSDRKIVATGEEELLAFYLRNINDQGVHDFVVPSHVHGIFFDEGQWADFSRRPERLAQIAENKISYAWDELIETCIKHALAGTHYFSTHKDIKYSEKIYRFLARESRLRRRFLAHSIIELIDRTPSTLSATRLILPSHEGDPYYVFVLLPHLNGIPYDEYRDVRFKLLESYCRVTKLKYPKALDIIGIATEPGNYPRRSEDVMYFDGRVWTEEDRVDAESLQKDFGLLKELKMFTGREKEYPDIDHPTSQTSTRPAFKLSPNPRNKPCPCGSGIKYKRCHGR